MLTQMKVLLGQVFVRTSDVKLNLMCQIKVVFLYQRKKTENNISSTIKLISFHLKFAIKTRTTEKVFRDFQ